MGKGADDWWIDRDDEGPPEDRTTQVIAEIPSPEELTSVIRREKVSQARLSYYCALVLAVTACLLMFFAVGLFLRGSVAGGALTIAGGAISMVVGKTLFRLNRESNGRVGEIERGLVGGERARLFGE